MKVGVMKNKLRVWLVLTSAVVIASVTGCGNVGIRQGRGPESRQTTDPAAMATNASGGVSGFVAGGARADDAGSAWVLGSAILAVTRDGGQSWDQLDLPGKAAAAVNDVSVLPSETVVVTGENGQLVTVDTMAAGQSGWTSQGIQVPRQIGGAQIVDADGVLTGVMVTDELGSNESEGQWLYTPDGGTTWQILSAPVGGRATEEGGDLWLVGGVTNETLYESADQGVTWQEVTLPLGSSFVSGMYTLGSVESYGSGVVLTATNMLADGSTQVEVLEGASGSSGWTWTAGPLVGFAGPSMGSSAADGVLWVLGAGPDVDLIALSTGQVTTVNASGLPGVPGVNAVYALSSTSALATYSTITCAGPERGEDCSTTNGLLTTTDGGSEWSAASNPVTSLNTST